MWSKPDDFSDITNLEVRRRMIDRAAARRRSDQITFAILALVLAFSIAAVGFGWDVGGGGCAGRWGSC